MQPSVIDISSADDIPARSETGCRSPAVFLITHLEVKHLQILLVRCFLFIRSTNQLNATVQVVPITISDSVIIDQKH